MHVEEEGLVIFPGIIKGPWGGLLSPIFRRILLIMLYQWWGDQHSPWRIFLEIQCSSS